MSLREGLTDPAVQSSWRVVDAALRRLVVDLSVHEVSAWSLLRHFHERALPVLADATRTFLPAHNNQEGK